MKWRRRSWISLVMAAIREVLRGRRKVYRHRGHHGQWHIRKA